MGQVNKSGLFTLPFCIYFCTTLYYVLCTTYLHISALTIIRSKIENDIVFRSEFYTYNSQAKFDGFDNRARSLIGEYLVATVDW